MEIWINGDAREVRSGITVRDLLVELGLGARGIAVEINREVVPRAAHADRVIREGDRVEIIRMVGGG